MASGRPILPLPRFASQLSDPIDVARSVKSWTSGNFQPSELLVTSNDSLTEVKTKLDNIASVVASGASLAVTMGELVEPGLAPGVVARAKQHMNHLERMHFENWQETGQLPTLDFAQDRTPLSLCVGGYRPGEHRRLALARLYNVKPNVPVLENLVYLHQTYPYSVHLLKAMERVLGKERAESNNCIISAPAAKEFLVRHRLAKAAHARRVELEEEARRSGGGGGGGGVRRTVQELEGRASNSASSIRRVCTQTNNASADAESLSSARLQLKRTAIEATSEESAQRRKRDLA